MSQNITCPDLFRVVTRRVAAIYGGLTGRELADE
jgi:hypothetical protein